MTQSEASRVRTRRAKPWATVVLGTLTLASALSFAGALWWVLDLLAHFHAIYFWVAVVIGMVMAALRWWRQVAWAGALMACEGLLLLPLYSAYAGAEAPTPGAPRLRVVSYNILRSNPHTPDAAAHVAALDPDVVVLLEVTPEQLPVFTAALPGWHVLAEPREDAFGIAVLTRRAPLGHAVLDLGSASMPVLEIEYEVAGRTVAIAAAHPPPPVSARLSHTRDRMLRGLSSWAAEQDGPALVVGDLNATRWSVAMREILETGPLRSAHRFGLQGTWPSFLGPLAVPIDQALVAGALESVTQTVEPAFGSDHRMLRVELELR